MTTILAFIIVFGILVFAHEFGHFIAARLLGVQVQEFAFGFFRQLWSKTVNGVKYSIRLVPIGGFVKLKGEEEALGGEGKPSKDPKSYASKKPWEKIIILSAGVVMNFILCWLLLTAFYLFGGRALVSGMWNHPGVNNTQKVYVVGVASGSPAEKNGIMSGDAITKVDGTPVYGDEEVFLDVQNKTNGQVALEINRGGQILNKNLSTYKETIGSGDQKTEITRIGITMETKGKIQAVWYMAPVAAAAETGRITALTAVGLWDFFATIFTQFRLSGNAGGPVAIAQYSGIALSLGFWYLVQFIAVLSLSLGLINIVPFPLLDGGHVATVLAEWISGKRIPARVKEVGTYVGFGLLLLLAVAVTANDLGRIGLFNWIMGVFKK